MHRLRALVTGVVAGCLMTLLGAGSALGVNLGYTGSLALQLGTLPGIAFGGAGTADVTADGGFHLSSMVLSAGEFGPFNTSIPVTSSATIQSVRFSSLANTAASFTGISGGGGGGPMGISGLSRICLFAGFCGASVDVPFTPTGSTGFGVGGSQVVAGSVYLTLQHSPWQISPFAVTIHDSASMVTTPVITGMAHGPASNTSTTGQPGGAVQLVTVTKVFTSLTTAFPELPVFGVLDVNFAPEPGTLLAGSIAVVAVLALARRRSRP